MRVAIVFSVTVAAAVGVMAPALGAVVPPLDAQPEGLIAGAALLMLAWLLRQGLPHKDAK